MNEYKIQRLIINDGLPSSNLFVPNIHGGCGEMDVLKLTKAGYAYEFEIKTSRADFYADTKKQRKHKCYSQVYENIPRLYFSGKPMGNKGIPNYFCYIAPKGIIPLDKVPDYAGLTEIIGDGIDVCFYFNSVKIPPRIHKDKFRDYWITKVAHSLQAKYYYHYWLSKGNEVKSDIILE